MKLVRDFIPAIIAKSGDQCEWKYVQGKQQFFDFLKEKMEEETQEFVEKPSAEEAADMLEVLMTFIHLSGISYDDVEATRQNKYMTNGGFKSGIILM